MADRWMADMAVADLVEAERNAKAHDEALIDASLDRFGYIEPIVLDERTGRIISGHGRRERLLAAQAAGDTPPEGVSVDAEGRWVVKVVRGWASPDDTEADAAGIALNRIGEAGGWRRDVLAEMLGNISASFPDGGLIGVGYGADDLAELLAGLAPVVEPPAPLTDPDDVPAAPADPVTVRGDVWLLGPHRLMCGDSRDADDVKHLMAGAAINLAFTSPPYADRREYDSSSGFHPVRPDEYVGWFEPVAANVAAHLADDGSWFVNIKASVTPDGLDTEMYVFDLIAAHVRMWGWHFATELCWERNGVPKNVTRRFKNQFEPIFQFARGPWKMRPDAVRHESSAVPIAGGPGVGQTTWAGSQGGNGSFFGGELIGAGLAYPGNRLPTFAGSHEATGHSAAFPVGLPEWFIKAYTDLGDDVYDPFMGSGSTLIAAHQADRVGYGMEISTGYCDVVCRRFQRHTGIKPIRESTGEPVDFEVAGGSPKRANVLGVGDDPHHPNPEETQQWKPCKSLASPHTGSTKTATSGHYGGTPGLGRCESGTNLDG